MPVSGARLMAAATAVHATASAEDVPPVAATTAATTAAGASTRSAVSDSGWATSVAPRPAAQPAHRPIDASVRSGTGAVWSALANAGPAVNGNANHQTRRIHGNARRKIGGSTAGEIYGQIRLLRPERW